jgi:3-O-methylgallate 3,4-dioxygenase
MSEIVLGVGTSHTPQLSSGWELWSDHANRDKGAPLLGPDGEFHTFDDLVREDDEALRAELDPAVWERKYTRAQQDVDTLGRYLTASAPDVVVLVGDDQREIFDDDAVPAIGLYTGDGLWDLPSSGEHKQRIGKFPGLAAAEWARHAPEGALHQVHAGLSSHLAESLTAADFDVTLSSRQRDGHTLGHAFTFPRYRLGLPETVPIVPVFLNTYYQPNVPSPARCYALGRALAEGIKSFGTDLRVAVLASGGLSHFVVLEDWDREVLARMAAHDGKALGAIPRRYFRSGTSEVLNWITVAGALEGARMTVVDYVPGYRSMAGTGAGMGFAVWQP